MTLLDVISGFLGRIQLILQGWLDAIGDLLARLTQG